MDVGKSNPASLAAKRKKPPREGETVQNGYGAADPVC